MKLIKVGSLVLIGLIIGSAFTTALAAAPKITVSKYVYETLDPKGPYVNAQGLHYSYKQGYLGFFLRDNTIYFQTVDCSAVTGTTTPTYPPCYYEYGVDSGTPNFLYGNTTLPSPQ